MVLLKEIYAFLDQKAPFHWQESYDNAGFLVGRREAVIHRVLVALDITPEIIQEAVEKHCELIVSHHPVIWEKPESVTDESLTGEKLIRLLENGIAAICAHTNLDAAEGGVNTVLAEKMGLDKTVPLEIGGTDENGVPYGVGRVGTLPEPVPLADFAKAAKKALSLEGIRVMDAGKPVCKIAVGGGACGGMLPKVKALGCDTFLTADLKHSIYLEARQMGINLLDAGHYSTEAIICPVVAEWLRERFPDLTVFLAENQSEVFHYL